MCCSRPLKGNSGSTVSVYDKGMASGRPWPGSQGSTWQGDRRHRPASWSTQPGRLSKTLRTEALIGPPPFKSSIQPTGEADKWPLGKGKIGVRSQNVSALAVGLDRGLPEPSPAFLPRRWERHLVSKNSSGLSHFCHAPPGGSDLAMRD